MNELNGDFELSLIKKDNKFECNTIIHFNDGSKIDKKEFSNYKKLLKHLKILIKSSVKFQEAIILLEEFRSTIEEGE